MAALRCACEQGTDIWGEVWWVGDRHRWLFFDDGKMSETYGEQITHCPGCAKRLQHEELRAVVA
jgi:hypothetical protein